jgi:hypothetical protein
MQIAARSVVGSDKNCCCKCGNEVAAKSINKEFSKPAKVVKSLMRVLDGREQATLSRLMLKLRKGDVVKFVREIRMYDDEDWERVVKDGSVSG